VDRAVKPFKLPKKSLGDLAPDVVARLIGISADVALVVDAKGIIRDMAVENDELAKEGAERWLGKPWIDTVTIESRPKVQELLSDAGKSAAPRWRQVNHPSPRGRDLPVRYAALEVTPEGRIIAIGRDLRAMSSLQQQIVDAQRQMESEYQQLRQSETRYRALFYSTSEAVMIVDVNGMKVLEANPRAAELSSKVQRKLVGRTFTDLFDAASGAEIQALLAELRTQPHSSERVVRFGGQTTRHMLSGSMMRQESGATFLIARLVPLGTATEPSAKKSDADVRRIVSAMPDAFVVADADGRIVTANDAFLALSQLASEDQARGQPLERWIGRAAADMAVLLANLKEHGTVRRFNTVIQGEFGSAEDVEISAVSALGSTPPVIGFVVRPSDRRDRTPDAPANSVMPRSMEQMTALVGRVPLKDLVRETTDIIERMCIEAALELTKDNRASAAEILGLSRQGLYTKLRRYGIGDEGDDEA
jgi:transcriptional regulator PpsR